VEIIGNLVGKQTRRKSINSKTKKKKFMVSLLKRSAINFLNAVNIWNPRNFETILGNLKECDKLTI
jgi:hypothetical protein